MRIAVPKEAQEVETRVAIVPEVVTKICQLGAEVSVEAGLGETIYIKDTAYHDAGAKVVTNRQQLLEQADIVLRLRPPTMEDVGFLQSHTIHISFLDPFNQTELLNQLLAQRVSAISMEMIPRITRAQKMDALSSQANLAGYSTVILAANQLRKAFPMMMTAAGTIYPARVFVIGVGVAGLQAIATAKRLGARVEAFDTRPVVAEQVQSLGAKFIQVELGETGQTKQGYAKALTPEQLAKQREAMTKVCAYSDVVITTAQLFGRKAPRIITREMIAQMQPGSVIVDMAVGSGGNVEGSVVGETVVIDGVQVIGQDNLPGEVAVHASQMYANNVYQLLAEYWDKDKRQLTLPLTDDIIKGCLITHNGEIVNPQIVALRNTKV